MNKNSKCFIKNADGSFQQITYEKLCELKKKSKKFRDKKFAKVDGVLFEISKDKYNEYNAEDSKNKYSKNKEEKLRKISLSIYINNDDKKTDEMYELIPALKVNVENETERKIELEELNNALLSLSDEEYEIIRNLFFKGLSIRKYSEQIGIPKSVLFDKKEKIIKKLKKILKNSGQ